MAKDLMQNLKKNPHNTASATSAVPVEGATEQTAPAVQKRKVGRPKTKEGEFKTINVSVPVETLEKMEVAKLKYGNNLTAYVNAVITADLEKNYDNYVKLKELLNS